MFFKDFKPQESIENLNRDEENLKEKRKKKNVELERSKKRLSRLQQFRPSFMDEFETREQELQQQYTQYVDRFRNLEYLERELERYRAAEEELIQRNNRRLRNIRVSFTCIFSEFFQKRIKDEELKVLRGEKLQDPELDIEEEEGIEK